jgi:nucleoside-diphosphate-sugar epimerase
LKALVTGASGFVGGAVARALLARGAQVRVLLRPGSVPNLPEVDEVEIARGDLRDAQAVSAAARGCDAIFHVGALYSFSASANDVLACNVGGTRNAIAAARESGARLVYTSSIATIGGIRDGIVPDEECMPVGPPPGPYKKSKWEAEALVRDEARRGLSAVIVNPTFPVGVGDVTSTSTTSPRATCSRSSAGGTASATSSATRTSPCASCSRSSRRSPAARRRASGCRTRWRSASRTPTRCSKGACSAGFRASRSRASARRGK